MIQVGNICKTLYFMKIQLINQSILSKSTIILFYTKHYDYIIHHNVLYVYKKIFLLVESLINISLKSILKWYEIEQDFRL